MNEGHGRFHGRTAIITGAGSGIGRRPPFSWRRKAQMLLYSICWMTERIKRNRRSTLFAKVPPEPLT